MQPTRVMLVEKTNESASERRPVDLAQLGASIARLARMAAEAHLAATGGVGAGGLRLVGGDDSDNAGMDADVSAIQSNERKSFSQPMFRLVGGPAHTTQTPRGRAARGHRA